MTAEEIHSARKKIVVCSDGTGNAGGRGRGSNVWRIRQAVLRKEQSTFNQVVLYEDGVGTQSLAPVRLLGNAFGFGLKQDLRLLYGKLIREFDVHIDDDGNYIPDELYLFGFSRGAFTIRTFAHMLYLCGIPDVRDKNGRRRRSEEIDVIVEAAIQAYASRIRCPTRPEEFRQRFGREWDLKGQTAEATKGRFPIRFIGVWDTVSAVGLPFENITQQLTKWGLPFFRMNLRRRGHYSKWEDDLHPWIENAYQAVSIDDERQTFYPMLWLEFDGADKGRDFEKHKTESTTPNGTKRKIEQVWFPGVHSDVGGGYPKDHMALISMEWMLRHASREGLKLDQQLWHEFTQEKDDLGKMHDSRAGAGALYRFKRRLIPEIARRVGLDGSDGENDRRKPRIHASTFRRIRFGATDYAPAGVPLKGSYVHVDDPPVTKPADDTTQMKTTQAIGTSDAESADKEFENAAKRYSGNTIPVLQCDTRVFQAHSVALDDVKDETWQFEAHAPPKASEAEYSVDEFTRKEAAEITERLLALRRTTFHLFYTWLFSLIIVAYLFSKYQTSRGYWLESFGNEWALAIPVGAALLIAGICQLIKRRSEPIHDGGQDITFTAGWRTSGLTRDAALLTAVLIGVRPLSVKLAAWTLPDVVSPLIHGVGQSAFLFAGFGLALYLLFRVRAGLQRMTRAVNVPAWLNALGTPAAPPVAPCWTKCCALTDSKLSKWLARRFEQIVEPGVALMIVAGICLTAVCSSVGTVIMDSNVSAPENSEPAQTVLRELNWDTSPAELKFDTKRVVATGFKVRPGQVYRIDVSGDEQWKDWTLPASHKGLDGEAKRSMKIVSSLKPLPSAKYFRLLGSVSQPNKVPFIISSGEQFTVSASGELFIYVNDVPGAYWNNDGVGMITLSLVGGEIQD